MTTPNLSTEEFARLTPAGFAMYASNGVWKPARHLQLINRKLMQIASGEIDRLLVTIAPRMGKPIQKDRLVLMHDGSLKKIGDLVIGDQVITHKKRIRKVIAVQNVGKLPCKQIETVAKRKTIAALEHHFLTPEGWKKIQDIVPGMYLANLNGYDIEDTSNRSIEEFKLAGYFIGDGSVGLVTTTCNAKVTNMDPEIIQDLYNIGDSLGFKYITRPKKNTKAVDVEYSGGVRNWIREVGLYGKTSGNKVVPEFVFKGSKEKIAAFLAAYFMCDGTVANKGNTSKGKRRQDAGVEYYSISKELLEGVQHLLLRFGIKSNLNIKSTVYKKEPYISYRLKMSTQDSVSRFHDNIPIFSYKLDRLKYHRYPRKDFDAYYHSDEIINVQDVGEQECICIQVEEDKTYIVDDFITHNSDLITKYFPVWYLGTYPNKRILIVCYGAEFASQWGAAARDLMEEYGKDLFNIEVRDDTRARERWLINGHTGYLQTAGVAGQVLGKGADIIIVDDPIKSITDAQSPVIKERLWTWFSSTLYSRLTPNGAIIIAQQRQSTDDLAGRILEKIKEPGGEKWDHVNLPILALENEKPWPEGLGRKIGDSIWPEMWSKERILKIKNFISETEWNSMYNQQPTDDEGGLIKSAWFKYFSKHGEFYVLESNGGTEYIHEDKCYKFITIDTANQVTEESDYSVICTWVVTPRNDLLLLDCDRDHYNYDVLLSKVIEIYGKYQPEYIGVENMGIGAALIIQLRNKGLPVRDLKPGGKNKKSRATEPMGLVVRFSSGKIYFLQKANWLSAVHSELKTFPKGKNDDIVDCMSYAANELTKIDTQEEEDFAPFAFDDLTAKAGNRLMI